MAVEFAWLLIVDNHHFNLKHMDFHTLELCIKQCMPLSGVNSLNSAPQDIDMNTIGKRAN